MPCIDDEQMIKALGSDGPDEALREGVRVRRPEWGSQDLGLKGTKTSVDSA